MKKTTTKKKTANFTLAPDGFSIHTFELSRKLAKGEYRNIKSSLYTKAKTDGRKMYQAEDGPHVCRLFSNHGVRLTLHHNHQSEYSSYLIKMVINPRKLIDPECSYLGILKSKKSSIRQLSKAFSALFKGTEVNSDIDAYYVSRLDFCTNVHCDNSAIFREMVRVLRKLPTPAKYKRILKTVDPNAKNKKELKKEANLYNKHYIKFACGTHELVIYDKSYQISNEGLDVGYEKLPYTRTIPPHRRHGPHLGGNLNVSISHVANAPIGRGIDRA